MKRRGLIKPYSAQLSGSTWPFVSSSSDSKSSNASFTVLPYVVRVKLDGVDVDVDLRRSINHNVT